MKTIKYIIVTVVASFMFCSCYYPCPSGYQTQDAIPVYDATVNYVIRDYIMLTDKALLINEYMNLQEEEKDNFEDKYFPDYKIRFKGDTCLLVSDGIVKTMFVGIDEDLMTSSTTWNIVGNVSFDIVSSGEGVFSINVVNSIPFSDYHKSLTLEEMNISVKLTKKEVSLGVYENNYFIYGDGNYIERVNDNGVSVKSVNVDFAIPENVGLNMYIKLNNDPFPLRLYGGALNMKVSDIIGYEDINETIGFSFSMDYDNPYVTIVFRGVTQEIAFNNLIIN
jgi:hypothetical protein